MVGKEYVNTNDAKQIALNVKVQILASIVVFVHSVKSAKVLAFVLMNEYNRIVKNVQVV